MPLTTLLDEEDIPSALLVAGMVTILSG